MRKDSLVVMVVKYGLSQHKQSMSLADIYHYQNKAIQAFEDENELGRKKNEFAQSYGLKWFGDGKELFSILNNIKDHKEQSKAWQKFRLIEYRYGYVPGGDRAYIGQVLKHAINRGKLNRFLNELNLWEYYLP